MGLPGVVAQSNWVRASWSEVELELNLRKWQEQENVLHLISAIQRASTIIYTTRRSAPVRTEGVLLI